MITKLIRIKKNGLTERLIKLKEKYILTNKKLLL